MRDCGDGKGGNVVRDDDRVPSSERPSVQEHGCQRAAFGYARKGVERRFLRLDGRRKVADRKVGVEIPVVRREELDVAAMGFIHDLVCQKGSVRFAERRISPQRNRSRLTSNPMTASRSRRRSARTPNASHMLSCRKTCNPTSSSSAPA